MKTNADAFDGLQQTFPKLLQQAGYATALFGKWHVGTQPTGFDHYAVIPGQGRFHNPQLLETGMKWNDKQARVHSGYLTDRITDKAIDYRLDSRPARGQAVLM